MPFSPGLAVQAVCLRAGGGWGSPCPARPTHVVKRGPSPAPSTGDSLGRGCSRPTAPSTSTCPSSLLFPVWRSLDGITLPAGTCPLCSTWGLVRPPCKGTGFSGGLGLCSACFCGLCGDGRSQDPAVQWRGAGEALSTGWVPCFAMRWVCFDPNCLLGLCVWGMEPGWKELLVERVQEGRYWLGYSVYKHITLYNAPAMSQTHLCQCFSHSGPQHHVLCASPLLSSVNNTCAVPLLLPMCLCVGCITPLRKMSLLLILCKK